MMQNYYKLLRKDNIIVGWIKLFSSRTQVFELLNLRKFDQNEIKASYELLKSRGVIVDDSIHSNLGSASFNNTDMLNNIDNRLKKLASEKNIILSEKSLIATRNVVLGSDSPGIGEVVAYDKYSNRVTKLGEKLDPRIWNLGFSFLLTGSSVGIIIPCMPLLVTQLGIPPSEFGLVVSAFGLSKLLGNIPSGYLVEKYGRKPIMIGGLGLCSIGIGSIGLALIPGLGTPWLIGCRFLTGLGVAAFSAGGFMCMIDISTPLNRTRTIAPVMAAFSGGVAMGPAIGGLLITSLGLSSTYAVVGGMIALQTLTNQRFLTETKPVIDIPSQSNTSPSNLSSNHLQEISKIFSSSFIDWNRISKNDQMKRLVAMNGAYWFAYAGSQMTLLPLYMVGPVFNFGAYEIGGCFAFMSIVSVLFSQPCAYFADKFGKVPSILVGSGLMGVSMIVIPYATNLPELVCLLFPISVGSTALNASPAALTADINNTKDRPQALSLLRTVGDVGLLFGATFSGLLAHGSSLEFAIQCNGGILTSCIVLYLAHNKYYSTQNNEEENKNR
eukprot:gene9038-12185_t